MTMTPATDRAVIAPITDGVRTLRQLKKTLHTFAGFPVKEMKLFKSGKGDFTDVVIRCQDREWKAHRAILAFNCDFFRACFTSSFREAKDGIISMQDDDPDAVEVLLEHLYNTKRPLFTEKSTPIINYSNKLFGDMCYDVRSTTIVSVCTVADKYNVPGLLYHMADLLSKFPVLGSVAIAQADIYFHILHGLHLLSTKSASINLIKCIIMHGLLHIRDWPNELNETNQTTLRQCPGLSYSLILGLAQDHYGDHSCKGSECSYRRDAMAATERMLKIFEWKSAA